MGKRTKARECAFQMLYQWDVGGGSLERVVDSFWRVRTTTDETRARAETLLRGAQALTPEADELIAELATNWRFERIAAIDRNILRLGVYELMREPQTPAPVVIDEAVELAKRFGDADSAGFVNGVLDAVRRRLAAGPEREQRARKA